MCGRYASFRQAQALADAFDVDEMTEAARAIMASWNVAPTDQVRIVVEHSDDHRSLQAARWGLVPPWAASPEVGARMINARSETLADKPAFREPAAKRRCLVLADGYYEWHRYTPSQAGPGRAGGRRQPYYIHRPDEAPIAFAGLYSWWPDPTVAAGEPDRWLLSTTIVTGAARGTLERLHHREPIVLDGDTAAAWLDPGLTDARAATALLSEAAPPLTWHPVTTAVGPVANNHPGLIAPVENPPELTDLLPWEDDAARPGQDASPRADA